VGNETIWDLLHAGDWACANGDEEALARVARALAYALSGTQRMVAYTVSAMAEIDMRDATRRWGELTDELRAQVSVL
jgi:imidazolonepropionase-like amidohydrolase